MVGNITSLTNNGLRDWLVQRVTAVVIAAYTFFLVGFVLSHANLDFSTWQALFQNTAMQVATLITLLSILLHAWIGIWTVTTDYLKSTALRLSVQMAVVVALVCGFIWGILILWGM